MIEELSRKLNALYSNYMMFSKPHILPSMTQEKNSRFVDRQFQLKYTLFFVSSILGTIILSVGPLYYFWRQNNAIFVDIAYETAPNLVEHLEREFIWIHVFLIAGIIGATLFFSMIGYRFTAKIIAPIKLLRNHINMLSRGHWHISPLKVRSTDEFQDLVSAYNYFFYCFKHNTINDIQRIEKIVVDPTNNNSYLAWKSLIEEKYEQLNIHKSKEKFFTLNGEGVAESHDQRHVS